MKSSLILQKTAAENSSLIAYSELGKFWLNSRILLLTCILGLFRLLVRKLTRNST